MYQIGTNPNAPLGGAWSPEQSQQTLPGSSYALPARGDGVAPNAFAAFGGSSAYGNSSYAASPSGGWFSSASNGLGGVMSSFYSAIQNLFSQISSSLGGSSATGTSYASSAPACAVPAASQEQGYTSAVGSSLGDPHLSFDGTSAAGTAQDGKWDDMNSHADLIDSDSFAGGYAVSTTATGQTNGVSYNKSATVTTDGGATAVTFSGDGTLQITQNGQSVAIDRGQSIDLGNGETVTSDQSGTSASVVQSTGHGGSLSTQFKENGQGVDVTATAKNVDLGGYLVTGRDSAPPTAHGVTPSPISYEPIYAGGTLAGGSWNEPGDGYASWNASPYGSSSTYGGQTQPYELAGFTDPTIDEGFA